MTWRFWRKKDQACQEVLASVQELQGVLLKQGDALQNLQQQSLALQDQQGEIAKFLNSFAQRQYRWNLENIKKLDDNLTEQARACELEKTLEKSVGGLLELLDDLEAITSHDGLKANPLTEVICKWEKQLNTLLLELGVEPIAVLGTIFDPKVAEAVATVSIQKAQENSQSESFIQLQPYSVVDVIKKGYRISNEKIIRKALVITIEEGAFADGDS